ncbi:hypothetical protein Tco_0499633 [Tanacetum coccineum]
MVGSFKALLLPLTPFPSTDEPEKRPLKEFLIKFLALNRQRPLTLDFHTFCSSTGLDSNNGKYVAHPAPKVLGGNYSSTEQFNSIQQLLAYSLITGTEVDIGEIIYSDLVTKLLNKSRLKYVSYPRFISCALQVLLEVDPDTEPLKLQTYADIQAFLLSDDELDKDSDEEEVFTAGDDMDEDP